MQLFLAAVDDAEPVDVGEVLGLGGLAAGLEAEVFFVGFPSFSLSTSQAFCRGLWFGALSDPLGQVFSFGKRRLACYAVSKKGLCLFGNPFGSIPGVIQKPCSVPVMARGQPLQAGTELGGSRKVSVFLLVSIERSVTTSKVQQGLSGFQILPHTFDVEGFFVSCFRKRKREDSEGKQDVQEGAGPARCPGRGGGGGN